MEQIRTIIDQTVDQRLSDEYETIIVCTEDFVLRNGLNSLGENQGGRQRIILVVGPERKAAVEEGR